LVQTGVWQLDPPQPELQLQLLGVPKQLPLPLQLQVTLQFAPKNPDTHWQELVSPQNEFSPHEAAQVAENLEEFHLQCKNKHLEQCKFPNRFAGYRNWFQDM